MAALYTSVTNHSERAQAIVTATHKRAELAQAAEIMATAGKGLGIV
jgi:hypothetical protein